MYANKTKYILRAGMKSISPKKTYHATEQQFQQFNKENSVESNRVRLHEIRNPPSRAGRQQSFSNAGKKQFQGISSQFSKKSSTYMPQNLGTVDYMETSKNSKISQNPWESSSIRSKISNPGTSEKYFEDKQQSKPGNFYYHQRQTPSFSGNEVVTPNNLSVTDKGSSQALFKVSVIPKSQKPPLRNEQKGISSMKDSNGLKRELQLPALSSMQKEENSTLVERLQSQLKQSESTSKLKPNNIVTSKELNITTDKLTPGMVNSLTNVPKSQMSYQPIETPKNIKEPAKQLEQKEEAISLISKSSEIRAEKEKERLKETQKEIQTPTNNIDTSSIMTKYKFQYLKRSAAGLNNIGNTCFMNSALQCVMNTPIFNEYFFSDQYRQFINPKNKGVASSYASLISSVRSTGVSTSQAPSSLKRSIERVSSQFLGYDQQDAQELLGKLLEGLHEDLNRVREKPKYRELTADINKMSLQNISEDWFTYNKQRDDSIVTDFFAGQLLSKVSCGKCGNESLAFDNFMDLSLSFSRDQEGSTQLTDMMRNFFRKESLDDSYYCSKCKKHTQSYRQLELFKLPQILVIHLKRFNFGRARRDKINSSVSFPFSNFDLSQFINNSQDETTKKSTYDLFGIVNHSGGLSFGHYTSESLNPSDGKWYSFNDSIASPISSEQISRGSSQGRTSPYMLFYCKQSLLQPYLSSNMPSLKSNL